MTDLEAHNVQECEHVLCTCDGAVLFARSSSDRFFGRRAHEAASADARIPNMTCTPPSPRQRELRPSQWNNCVGMYTFQNGNVYSGEFHHGGRDGFGVLEIKFIGQSTDNMIGWNEPAIYVGSFRDGFRNGYGLLIAKSAIAYAGMFKDNLTQ